MEIAALTRLHKQGVDNLSILLPMVRTVEEVKRAMHYIGRSVAFPIWVKCETPAMSILMEDLCNTGIAGVCFDVPSLAQFILGFDKDNSQTASEVDQAHPAVLQALRYALATCREHRVATILAAEMDTLNPEVVQLGAQEGVTALSVHAGDAEITRRLLAAVEKHLLLEHALKENG